MLSKFSFRQFHPDILQHVWQQTRFFFFAIFQNHISFYKLYWNSTFFLFGKKKIKADYWKCSCDIFLFSFSTWITHILIWAPAFLSIALDDSSASTWNFFIKYVNWPSLKDVFEMLWILYRVLEVNYISLFLSRTHTHATQMISCVSVAYFISFLWQTRKFRLQNFPTTFPITFFNVETQRWLVFFCVDAHTHAFCPEEVEVAFVEIF